jgi:arylsulfatase A-like enzyme
MPVPDAGSGRRSPVAGEAFPTPGGCGERRPLPRRYFGGKRLFPEPMNHRSTPYRRPLLALVIIVALGAVLVSPGAAAAANAGGKPNVVVITTDDQTLSMVNSRYMPHTTRLLTDRGTTFTDFIVTTPLCCPSRASLITGQYGHNNGVLKNDYAKLIGKGNTLPVWLRRAGYRTIHIGKYLNGYGIFADRATDIAPGWDQWLTQISPRRYLDYDLSLNGSRRSFGHRERDYLTTVLNRRAEAWTRRFAKSERPFYLQLDHFAPHKSSGRRPCNRAAMPAQRDEHRFDAEPLPLPPSYDELDVSDKPFSVRELPPIDAAGEERIEKRFRCAVEALRSVDRGVKKIRRALKKAREWNETVLLFTTDNGFFYGEHRIRDGKEQPYEENIHLPLIIRVPSKFRGGGPRVSAVDEPAANIDIAPTILALAGAESCNGASCRAMDGRSLLGLIRGDSSWSADRALLIEKNFCRFRGLRASGYILLEHQTVAEGLSCVATDEGELYDLRADPFQLDNLFGSARRSEAGLVQQQMETDLLELRDCAGIEGRDPEPQSGVYCE